MNRKYITEYGEMCILDRSVCLCVHINEDQTKGDLSFSNGCIIVHTYKGGWRLRVLLLFRIQIVIQ